ncbi:MAG: hypothetical protein ACI9LU_000366 [Polaribacter sp.]
MVYSLNFPKPEIMNNPMIFKSGKVAKNPFAMLLLPSAKATVTGHFASVS